MSLAFIPTAPLAPRTHPRHAPLIRRRLSLHPRRTPPPSRTHITPNLSAAARQQASPTPTSAPPSRLVRLTFLNTSVKIPGRALLCLVPLLWASFIACAKLLYLIPKALSPSAFNAARLLVSSLFFLPTLLSTLRRPARPADRRRLVTAGLELGALMFVANCVQIAGLRYTDASRAAFLTQLSTVLVPLAAAAAGVEALTPRVSAGALLALAGVALLTLGGNAATVAAVGVGARLGDALELLSAVFITLYVLRVSQHARANRGASGALVAVKVVTQAVMSVGWLALGAAGGVVRGTPTAAAAAVRGVAVPWTPMAVLVNVLLVLWAGVLVSAATSWMQTKGQAAVPASEAAILYAAQPLWASVIATAFLGETLGPSGMVGAGLIVAGTVVSSTGNKES